jgi:radical SAM superfamily enzyme YgiQ (UPF0313 family)
MKKLSIYLANLSHFHDGIASTESIPLNIGFLATYLKKYLKEDCQICLFNSPYKLEKVLDEKVPDIFACSNYVWNFNLNYLYLSHIKKHFPDTLTIMGGPNYPGTVKKQEAFLHKHDKIDIYIYMEGEKPFLKLTERYIQSGFKLNKIIGESIRGCHSIYNGKFVNGGKGERVDELDSLPSPYLDGTLDGFLEEGFVPMLQTNRGCSFSCAFCYVGNRYYTKTYKFKIDRILKEIDYISSRVKSKSLHITDSNFGIFEQDVEISYKLSERRNNIGWPLMVSAATSKLNKKRVAECISVLGNGIIFSASTQSFNKATLSEVRRTNMPFDKSLEIVDKLRDCNVSSQCELIIGLPHETTESHLDGIRTVVDAGIDIVVTHTCILLDNTSLKENVDYDRFNMVKKYRVIPRAFGAFLGINTIEIEEVCVATKDLSMDDYIYLRSFHFVLSSFYIAGAIKEIIEYLRNINVSIFDFLIIVREYLSHERGTTGNVYNSFVTEAKNELFDSKEDIMEYYSKNENFKKLLDGKRGANLLAKYQAIFLDNMYDFVNLVKKVITNEFHQADSLIINNIAEYCVALRGNIFDQKQEKKVLSLSYDIPQWANNGMKENLSQMKTPIQVTFAFTEKQTEIINSQLSLYGDANDSKGRILTRIPTSMIYRNCSYV